MAFALMEGARHSLIPTQRRVTLTTPQASLHATDRIVAPPSQGFRRWASTPDVSLRRCQPATGPPGSYPDRTHTGRRRRACEHKDQLHEITASPPVLLDALQILIQFRMSASRGATDVPVGTCS